MYSLKCNQSTKLHRWAFLVLVLSHHDYTSNPFNPSQGVRLFPISLSASIVSWHRHNLILCGFSAGHKCKPQLLAWWRTGEGAGGTLACRWCCGLFLSSPLTEEASSTDVSSALFREDSEYIFSGRPQQENRRVFFVSLPLSTIQL